MLAVNVLLIPVSALQSHTNLLVQIHNLDEMSKQQITMRRHVTPTIHLQNLPIFLVTFTVCKSRAAKAFHRTPVCLNFVVRPAASVETAEHHLGASANHRRLEQPKSRQVLRQDLQLFSPWPRCFWGGARGKRTLPYFPPEESEKSNF